MVDSFAWSRACDAHMAAMYMELFEKAAQEGIELPDVARGYLMLRGARLGPERKAIVQAAAGQSYTERNVAQGLRSSFPINLGVTKEFVHVMDDCDQPLMPLEEQAVSEVDPGEKRRPDYELRDAGQLEKITAPID